MKTEVRCLDSKFSGNHVWCKLKRMYDEHYNGPTMFTGAHPANDYPYCAAWLTRTKVLCLNHIADMDDDEHYNARTLAWVQGELARMNLILKPLTIGTNNDN